MRVRDLALLFVLATGLTLPTPAVGQSAIPEQLVALKSGVVLVGALVEYVPGSHITLRLATGEVRRTEWADIQNHSPPGTAPAPPQPAVAPPPPAPVAPPVPARPDAQTIVHIETNDPAVTLTRQMGQGAVVGYGYNGSYVGTVTMWQNVCRAPCDQPVDRSAEYAIRGNGITPSGLFTLPASGPTLLRVRAGRFGARLGSAMAIGFGVMGIITGAIMVGMGPLIYNPNDPFVNDPFFTSPAERAAKQAQSRNVTIAGGVILGVGILATGGGIAGVVLSGTKVTVE